MLKPEVCHNDHLPGIKLSKNYASIKEKTNSNLIKHFKNQLKYIVVDYPKLYSSIKEDLECMIKSKEFKI